MPPGEVGTQNPIALLGVKLTLLNENNNQNFRKAAAPARAQWSQFSHGRLPPWISQENSSLIHQVHLIDKRLRNSNR